MKRLYGISGLIALLGAALLGVGLLMLRGSSVERRGFSTTSFKERVFESNTVKDIEIKESYESVIIEKGDTDKLTIRYYVPENEDNVSISENNGLVKFERKKTKININLSINMQDTSTVVTLPKDFKGTVDASASSGAVKIKDIQCEDLSVTTSSGSINLENVISDKSAEIVATSGAIKVSSLTAFNDVSVTALSGSLGIEKVSCNNFAAEVTSGSVKVSDTTGKTASFEASSGSVKLDNVSFEDKVNISTTSGSIHFEALKSNNISAEASSGSIRGTIAGKQSEYSVISKTSSGACNLENTREGNKILDVKTTSGSINVSFD